MSIPYVVDGETELSSELFNPWVDQMNGLQTGALPIALAGIEGALGEYAASDSTPVETVIYDHIYSRSADASTNRVNLQTLLDRIKPTGSGKQVRLFLPPKFASGLPDPIVVNQSGANAWCVDVPSNVSIEGAGYGSTVQMAAGQANFTRMFRVNGKNRVAFRRLRLDGNRANQSVWEQNHNISIYDSSDVVIEDVESVEAMGDGINLGSSLAGACERVWIDRCTVTDNQRNPITINEACDVWITDSFLHCMSTGGQAIDSEPNQDKDLWGLYVAGCVLSHESTTGDVYAVALSGRSSYPRRLVRLIGNEFRNGGIWARASKDVVISGNTGNPKSIDGLRYSENVAIIGNMWEFSLANASGRCIELGYSGGTWPKNWTIAGNQFRTNDQTIVYAWSTDGLLITGNVMDLGGATTFPAIMLRSNDDSLALQDVLIAHNRIGNGYRGIELIDHASAISDGISIVNNQFHDLSSNWLRGNGVTKFADLLISGNVQRSTGAINEPGGAYRIGNGAWSCSGTPEGQVTAPIGSVAYRRDGGASTTMYIKESGTGNTGWRAV